MRLKWNMLIYLSSQEKMEEKVRSVIKGNRTAKCLNGFIWDNGTKTRIYTKLQ